MKHEKSCGAICITSLEGTPHVLIISHRLGGNWAFPKGHVEENETEEETAIREVLEETGIDISIRKGFRELSTYSMAKNKMKTVVYFVADPLTFKVVPQPQEVRKACFVTIDEALATLTYEADRNLLKKAMFFRENP